MKSAEVDLLSLEFCLPAVPMLRLQAVRRGILFGFLNAKRHLPSLQREAQAYPQLVLEILILFKKKIP